MPDLRFTIVQRLKALVKDRPVEDLARDLGVTISRDGKINKGWVGQTLDRLAETEGLSSQQPDGPDFELKSVSVFLRHNEWLPKETVAITMFNPERILSETFRDSALWHKLERLILVGHSYNEGRRDSARVRFIAPVDVSDPELSTKIEHYWADIQELTAAGKIATYSSRGTSSGFIQLRTKGDGKRTSTCPVTQQQFKTRAFYATKAFVRYVRGTMV